MTIFKIRTKLILSKIVVISNTAVDRKTAEKMNLSKIVLFSNTDDDHKIESVEDPIVIQMLSKLPRDFQCSDDALQQCLDIRINHTDNFESLQAAKDSTDDECIKTNNFVPIQAANNCSQIGLEATEAKEPKATDNEGDAIKDDIVGLEAHSQLLERGAAPTAVIVGRSATIIT